MKKMQHQVTIQEVDNGYVVRVGCKLVVFEDKATLLMELKACLNGKETELSERLKKEDATDQAVPQPCDPTQNLGQTLARA